MLFGGGVSFWKVVVAVRWIVNVRPLACTVTVEPLMLVMIPPALGTSGEGTSGVPVMLVPFTLGPADPLGHFWALGAQVLGVLLPL